MRNENQMSTTPDTGIRTSRSGGVGWYVAIVLLVLYPLSMGPCVFFLERFGLGYSPAVKSVFVAVYAPVIWLCKTMGVGDMLNSYMGLWV
jgi:hypothetical protein